MTRAIIPICVKLVGQKFRKWLLHPVLRFLIPLFCLRDLYTVTIPQNHKITLTLSDDAKERKIGFKNK